MEPESLQVNDKRYVREDLVPPAITVALDGQEHPYPIGCFLYVETPTKYYVGMLVAVTQQELVLENTAWVADTGRFHKFMQGEQAQELEPCGPGIHIIGRGAVVSARPMEPVVLEVK